MFDFRAPFLTSKSGYISWTLYINLALFFFAINIETSPILNGGEGLNTKSTFLIVSPIISDNKCQYTKDKILIIVLLYFFKGIW